MIKAQVDDLGLLSGSPDGIRTRATALRGRRARPLHNGATGCGSFVPQDRNSSRAIHGRANPPRSAEGGEPAKLGYQDSNLD